MYNTTYTTSGNKLLILLVLSFLGLAAYASEKEEIDANLDEIDRIQYIFPDSSLALLNEVEQNNEGSLLPHQRQRILDITGNVHWHKGQMTTSILYYKKALLIAEERKDTSSISGLLADIGWVFTDLGQNDSAIVYLTRAIELGEKANAIDATLTAECYLAYCYSDMGEHRRALEIYMPVIEHYKGEGRTSSVHDLMVNVGDTYKSLGSLDTASLICT